MVMTKSKDLVRMKERMNIGSKTDRAPFIAQISFHTLTRTAVHRCFPMWSNIDLDR